MSFRCEGCGEAQLPKTCPIMKTVEMREQSYVNLKVDFETREKTTVLSKGTEIVKEMRMCPSCMGLEVSKDPIKPILHSLSESSASTFKQSIAASLVERMIERAKEIRKTGDSADRDFNAMASILAPYQKRGGGL